MMLDQMSSDNPPLQVDPDRDIHRFGRVAGTVHDVGAEKGITRYRAIPVSRIHRDLRHPFAETVRVGKHMRQFAHTGFGRLNGRDRKKRDQKQKQKRDCGQQASPRIRRRLEQNGADFYAHLQQPVNGRKYAPNLRRNRLILFLFPKSILGVFSLTYLAPEQVPPRKFVLYSDRSNLIGRIEDADHGQAAYGRSGSHHDNRARADWPDGATAAGQTAFCR
ncbi:hypothetical protein JL101_026185 [Skermanella rosea]|uniref:hypothetical protein n=1 Tax=Skermanella rosea TaxID=1817965 RepID=UPI0019326FFB|nr:hypothetical protein [Skermanella rosea]UEM06738.1 hypothetical protein JL101_026185 [Skermanella rosea]